MSNDTIWYILGGIAIVVIVVILYLKYKNPTALSSAESTASVDYNAIKGWIEAEVAKVKADLTPKPSAPVAPAPAPPPASVPVPAPAVAIVTPTGTVPSAAQLTELETATTQFHAAHAKLAAAAKAVAAP